MWIVLMVVVSAGLIAYFHVLRMVVDWDDGSIVWVALISAAEVISVCGFVTWCLVLVWT